MSSERSISPDPLPRSHSNAVHADEKDNGRNARQSSSAAAAPKRRRDSSRYDYSICFFFIFLFFVI